MRIGVDCTCWANGRGYGRFTRELLGAPVMPLWMLPRESSEHRAMVLVEPASPEQV